MPAPSPEWTIKTVTAFEYLDSQYGIAFATLFFFSMVTISVLSWVLLLQRKQIIACATERVEERKASSASMVLVSDQIKALVQIMSEVKGALSMISRG